MKSLKDYLKKAHETGFAIGQFNFSTQEQLKAIALAALKLSSPVIVGTSPGEADFIGIEQAVGMVQGWRRAAAKDGKKLAMFLNLDHAKSLESIKRAIDAGYDAVHFDGSELSFDKNVRITKAVMQYAKKSRAVVEGEIGRIGTESSRAYYEKFIIKEEDLTKPAQAKDFAALTLVDILAVSVGTFHGIQANGQNPHLKIQILKDIHQALPDVPLVLHGSSGTPIEDIKKAITLGVNKINVNTDLRIAFTKALRESLAKDPKQATPYKYLASAVDVMQKVVEEKIILFGSANKI